MLLPSTGMIENWWAETDDAIVQCLRERGAMSPVDLAQRLGITPGESTAFLCMLATQGKVKLRLVEASDDARVPDPALPSGVRRERARRVAPSAVSLPVASH